MRTFPQKLPHDEPVDGKSSRTRPPAQSVIADHHSGAQACQVLVRAAGHVCRSLGNAVVDELHATIAEKELDSTGMLAAEACIRQPAIIDGILAPWGEVIRIGCDAKIGAV